MFIKWLNLNSKNSSSVILFVGIYEFVSKAISNIFFENSDKFLFKFLFNILLINSPSLFDHMSIFKPFCAGSYNPANFIVDDSISLFISISELDWTDNVVLVFRLLLAFIFEVEFSLLMMSFFSIFQISIGSFAKEQLEKNQENYKNLEYYEEQIINHIENPTGRIKYKDTRKITIGTSKKDILSYRSRKKGAFYNCFVFYFVLLRLALCFANSLKHSPVLQNWRCKYQNHYFP